jgi:hypothetical protein
VHVAGAVGDVDHGVVTERVLRAPEIEDAVRCAGGSVGVPSSQSVEKQAPPPPRVTMTLVGSAWRTKKV